MVVTVVLAAALDRSSDRSGAVVRRMWARLAASGDRSMLCLNRLAATRRRPNSIRRVSVVTVHIGSTALHPQDVNEGWLNQQINRRRTDGATVCVQVQIQHGGINMRVSTPDCPTGSSHRLPTPQEQRILDLWDKLGLNGAAFAGGNVVAFLRQLERVL